MYRLYLPYVPEYYGKSVHKPLSELADLVGITEPSDAVDAKAKKFIEAVKRLNESMNIPVKESGIAGRDIPPYVLFTS